MFRLKKEFFFVLFLISLFSILLFVKVIIGPLILALLVAYLFDPLLIYGEKKGFSRTQSAFSIVFLFLFSVALISWVIFPLFYSQLLNLSKLLPDFKIYLETILLPKMQRITADISGQSHKKTIHLYEFFPLDLNKNFDSFLFQVGTSTKFIISWLILTILFPILMFFIMRDLRKIYNFILSLVPLGLTPGFIDVSKEIDQKLKSVIFGQVLVISILCVVYSVVLFIAGLPYAIAVGILTGIARLIPYFDSLVGAFLCFFVLVTHSADNKTILTVCLAFIAVQCLDGLFITPKIMGKFSGLHPFMIILSVLCFGSWFGFYGILLAIPLATVSKVLVKSLLNNYKNSRFFCDN